MRTRLLFANRRAPQSAANEFVIEEMQELFSRADDADIFQLILVA